MFERFGGGARSADAVRILPSRNAVAAPGGSAYPNRRLTRSATPPAGSWLASAFSAGSGATSSTSRPAPRTVHPKVASSHSMPDIWPARTTLAPSGDRFARAFFAKKTEIPKGKRERPDSLLRHHVTTFVENAAVQPRRTRLARNRALVAWTERGWRACSLRHAGRYLAEAAACARHRGSPPEVPAVWLPWGVGEERLRSPQGAAALAATASTISPGTRWPRGAASTAGRCRGRSANASTGATAGSRARASPCCAATACCRRQGVRRSSDHARPRTALGPRTSRRSRRRGA